MIRYWLMLQSTYLASLLFLVFMVVRQQAQITQMRSALKLVSDIATCVAMMWDHPPAEVKAALSKLMETRR